MGGKLAAEDSRIKRTVRGWSGRWVPEVSASVREKKGNIKDLHKLGGDEREDGGFAGYASATAFLARKRFEISRFGPVSVIVSGVVVELRSAIFFALDSCGISGITRLSWWEEVDESAREVDFFRRSVSHQGGVAVAAALGGFAAGLKSGG